VDDISRVLDQILTQLVRAGTVALFNAAQTFLGQLAYDAANYIATGGKGQGPLSYH
jgi:predicted kinase